MGVAMNGRGLPRMEGKSSCSFTNLHHLVDMG